MSEKISVFLVNSHDSSKRVETQINPSSVTQDQVLRHIHEVGLKQGDKVYLVSGEELDERNRRSIGEHDELFLSDGLKLDDPHELFHLCMLGAGAVGKSALTLQFIQGQFVADYDPTIEDAYRKQVAVDGNSVLLDVLDTAGQEDFIALRTSWMRGRDGFVLAFAINDRKTFDDLESFYDQLCEVYEDDVPPFILVGNKVDLDELNQRKVAKEEGLRRAHKWNCCAYIETSAKTGFHVQEMFGSLVREIVGGKFRKQHPPDEDRPKKRKWCAVL